MSDAGTAYYLYCLTPDGAPAMTGPEFAGWTPAVALRMSGFTAIVSRVPVEEFLGEAAAAGLRDIAWVGPRAGRHDSVIRSVMRHSPVLPAPFATLFSTPARLEQWLGQHRSAIAGYFAELGDKREWAVKGLLDRAAACAGLLAAQPDGAEPGAGLSGASYLLEKQRAAQAKREVERLLRQLLVEAAAGLQAQAAGFRERKVIPNAADSTAEVVLSWAFLVSNGGEAQFCSRLAELDVPARLPGLHFTLSGPWAPYSFAPALPADT
jgi:hypothetical protein